MAAADAQCRGPNIPEPDYTLLVRGELCVWQSYTTIAYYKIVAGDDKVNGRGLTIGSDDPANPIHDVYVYATMIQSSGDDGACVWNYAHDIHYDNCWFFHRSTWPDRNDYRFANKCFVAGADPDLPTPSYFTWWTASHCLYNGGFRSPAIRGGRFQIDKSLVLQSRRNVWTEATGNVVDTDFFVQYPMQVRGGDNPWADSWTRPVRPILLKRPIPEGLYFSGCRLFTLDGDGKVITARFASGSELCRLAPPGAGDNCEGCVDSDLDVPASMFRTTPWPIDLGRPIQSNPTNAVTAKTE